VGRYQESLLVELLALRRAALAPQEAGLGAGARPPPVEPLASQLRTAPPDDEALLGHERFEGRDHCVSFRYKSPKRRHDVPVAARIGLAR
jgi:hypothetical protein